MVVASLKLTHRLQARGHGLGFHDRMVVASLKPIEIEYDEGHRECPRPHGRGLIEADWSPGWCSPMDPFPRPHGRGLIEAPALAINGSDPLRFHDRMVVASLKRIQQTCVSVA